MTKRIFISIIFVVTCFSDSAWAQDWKVVHDGVEYANDKKQISGLEVNMDLLRVDPTKVRLDVNHAKDSAIGLEKTSSIATRHGAVAAINTGFFRIDTSIFAGDDVSVLKIDGHLLSTSHGNRTALLIRNDPGRTEIDIGQLSLAGSVKIGKHILDVIGINSERKKDDVIIYTPEFGRTTLTEPGGVEITVRSGKVKAISDVLGSSVIPSDGFVISAAASRRSEVISQLKIGAHASYEFSQVGSDEGSAMVNKRESGYAQAEDVVTGVVELVRNGRSQVDESWPREKTSKDFVETRHPRTAFAKLKDGKLLMITVDGRTESSGGIGLRDLADYLISIGAVSAMNLDGGGSTTMFLDGKVVNHPSDKEGERKVSDALLVTLRSNKH